MPTTRQPFNVLILYDGVHSSDSAMRTYNRLRQRFDKTYSFHVKIWRFDMLGLASCAQWAGRDAGHADLMIVATEGDPTTLDSFKAWTAHWTTKPNRERAMAALFLDQPEGSAAEQYKDWQEFLHDLCARAGMDLIASRVKRENDNPIDPTVVRLLPEVPHRHSTKGGSGASRPLPHRRWGINE